MKTRALCIDLLVVWGSVMLANAQQSTGYYFKEFTAGKVLLRNRQFAKGKFNYDCINKEMHFLNGTTDMVVENLDDIDTIAVVTATCTCLPIPATPSGQKERTSRPSRNS